VGLISRHWVPAAIVGAALAATAVVFMLFRPEFHPKGEDSLVKLDLSKYPPASENWVWQHGQPGFRFGDEEDKWNISGLKPAEIAAVGPAAARNGVAPSSLRPIESIRLGPGDLSMIVAGTNAADTTCLGIVTPSSTSFFCPPKLQDESALVFVTTRPNFESGDQSIHPTFINGIVRGDVTRVVVTQSDEWPNGSTYDRELGSLWGTFGLSLSDGRGIDLSVVRGGVVRTVHINETAPGDRVIAIPG
jgi:hypothetical protein